MSGCVVADCDYSAATASGYCTLHSVRWARPTGSPACALCGGKGRIRECPQECDGTHRLDLWWTCRCVTGGSATEPDSAPTHNAPSDGAE